MFEFATHWPTDRYANNFVTTRHHECYHDVGRRDDQLASALRLVAVADVRDNLRTVICGLQHPILHTIRLFCLLATLLIGSRHSYNSVPTQRGEAGFSRVRLHMS